MGRTGTLGSIRLRLVLASLAVIVAIGCGGSNPSPTGPSAIPGSTALVSAESADAQTTADAGEFHTLGKGPGKGGGKDKDKDKDKDRGRDDRGGDDPDDDNRSPGGRGGDNRGPDDDNRGPGGPGRDNRGPGGDDRGPGRSDEARVVGFVSATTADTLTVDGVSIAAAPDAIIRHGNRLLTLADIEVGDHVQARGVMEEGVLVAREIKVEETNRDNVGAGDVEIEGTIAGLSAASGCPVVTFTIGSATIRTTATTLFDDVTCATLANGARVEVDGAKQADGSIAAARVELK